jgi:zinc protease
MLRDTIKDKSVFSSPDQDLQIYSSAIESTLSDQILASFQSFWDTPDLKLVMNAQEAESDTAEVMARIWEESKQTEVEPPIMEVDSKFLYTSFGDAGKVVSDTTQQDLDIRQLQLSNNVRVNLKRTEFEADTIGITAQFGTGRLSQDDSKAGLQWFAKQMMNNGGLGKHSEDDLKRILAGKNVGVKFAVNEEFFTLSGVTTPSDLMTQLRLMTANIVDPGFRVEALQYWRQSASSYDAMFRSELDGAQFFVDQFLHGDDGRFSVPSLDEMNALSIIDAQNWLNPQLADSYIELSVVGDFDMDTTIPMILETFGALPNRDEWPPAVESELRSLQFPDTPGNHQFTYESNLPSASSIVVWDVPHIEDEILPTRQFNVLSSILTDRMRKQIREDSGESYSPRASADISEGFEYGIIRAESPGSADSSGSVGKQIVSIAHSMALGIEDDELVRAREPIMTSIERNSRSNDYWLNSVMLDSQAKPWKLEWARNMKGDYGSISLDDLEELAATYLMPENALQIEILPKHTDNEV